MGHFFCLPSFSGVSCVASTAEAKIRTRSGQKCGVVALTLAAPANLETVRFLFGSVRFGLWFVSGFLAVLKTGSVNRFPVRFSAFLTTYLRPKKNLLLINLIKNQNNFFLFLWGEGRKKGRKEFQEGRKEGRKDGERNQARKEGRKEGVKE